MNIIKEIPKQLQEYQKLTFENMKIHGLNTVQSCIMSYLQIQTEETTIEEIKKHTKYSTATISTTIKFLEKNKLIETSKRPGSKKIYVVSQKSPLKLLASKSKIMKEEFLKQKENLPKIIKELKELIKQEKNKTKKENYSKQLTIIKKEIEEKKIIREIMIGLQKELEKRGAFE